MLPVVQLAGKLIPVSVKPRVIENLPLGLLTPGESFRCPCSETIELLAESMEKIGLVNPILVRPVADGYEVVSGLMRYAAAQTLGWTEIPVIVMPMKDDEVIDYLLHESSPRCSFKSADISSVET